jgi:GH24 family phage-related lysozyme (muramidase)
VETVPSSQNTENTQDQQNAYDATTLAVKKIPETLLNYIDNRYEFQYSLYNWLYNHGKKNVESATVTDYSIDGDARQAVIDLQLSDGSGMTAVYDKSANSYSFER